MEEPLNNGLVQLTKKDFESDQEVRWCPGCGDYSILAAVQRVLPDLGIPKEKHVFVSGIGCSSRFPYYMNTYGMHSIHGRAPAIATGLKVANPDLKVWVITGDGDALSIGGNHFMHLMRRNVDLTLLLFNNRIYGLTKGQYSPTSEQGKVTKSTPYGSLESPVDPISLALACGASFVARSLDVDAKHLAATLKQAAEHKGTSIVEIFQNCNVFNDGAHEHVSDRKQRAENQLLIEHGQPLSFGSGKAIRLDGLRPEIVDNQDASGILIHDSSNRTVAQLIAGLGYPEFPTPMGVFFQEQRPCYEELAHQQVQNQKEKQAPADIATLLRSGDCWEVL